MERNYQVLGNLVRKFNISKTYVDKYDPWMVILAASELAILSTKNKLKGYSPGQLLFGRDMIIPIKHKADWELIRQQYQTQINKDNIHKNSKRVDHNYKVDDKVILNNNSAYKHETPYKGQFLIAQCWTNVTVTLQCGPTEIRHNIFWIKPYISDTNVEDINIQKYVRLCQCMITSYILLSLY